MSRFNPHENNTHTVYDAAEKWRDTCLIGDSSILAPGEAFWTTEFLDELDRIFVQRPDTSKSTYFEKLERQLEGASQGAIRLMAEVNWIVTLFPSNVTPDTKKQNVRTIWSWSNGTLESDNRYLQDDVLGGLGHGGPGFNVHKPREITFAITIFNAFKLMSDPERRALIEDPFAFARWLASQPDAGKRQFRHIILNLLFPDDFERISTAIDKLAILEAFEGRPLAELRQLDAVEIDRQLLDLRTRLEENNEREIDFYWGGLKEKWKPGPVDTDQVDPDEDDMPGPQIDDIFGRLDGNETEIKIREPYLGAAVIFSNTHRRNTDAWFVLTSDQIARSLSDVLDNLDAFNSAYDPLGRYEENTWRGLFAEHLTDDVARYMASVQTFPFFEVLSRAIHHTVGNGVRTPKTIELTKEGLERAIDAIRKLSVSGTVESDVPIEPDPKARAAEIGYNKIFYGAPGTGKSHKVNGLVGKANIVRTVFHPDTQNSDFFGCLKPQMHGVKVVYGFVPGPFSNALRAAMRDPKHQHFLVIEELNRAPAAAVFGELFQLLDRNDHGDGIYEVDFPNDESKDWFNKDGHNVRKLFMPSNLSIIATMNSADHGVYPLDTAFRRRWEQEYLPLEAKEFPEGVLHYTTGSNIPKTIRWHMFAKCLNGYLVDQFRTAEDRLLGQWFVRERELGGPVPAKILLYLWDDLLRHEGREKVFNRQIRTFGELDRVAKTDGVVFGADLLAALDMFAEAEPATSTADKQGEPITEPDADMDIPDESPADE